MTSPMAPRGREQGMTLIEMMIVIAIIGGFAYIAASGFRMVTKADLVDDASRLSAIMKRTSQLATTTGEIHRLVLDFEHKRFSVEACEGSSTVGRAKVAAPALSEQQRTSALDMARERLQQQNMLAAQALPSSPEADMARAAALAGQHVGDTACKPVSESTLSGDAEGRALSGSLRAEKGIKFREVWVQHLDESVTADTVAIHFFPIGSAEKAIVELTDGSVTFSILVFGLTGRIELLDGEVQHPDEHMMRDAEGNKEAER
jgi:prepilin-type N-terminal cleavage/methylation domain-containing protein